MARRGVIGLIAGVATAVLTGCGLIGGKSYRFRMTLEVDTSDGLRTGSSVYEVTAQNHAKLLPDMRGRSRDVRGEAVAVDLPSGQTLFALLKTMNRAGDDDLAAMSMATLDPAYKNDWVESAARIAAGDGIRSPAEVPPTDSYDGYDKGHPIKTQVSNYPMLVTFTDISDPSSVKLVDPADLAASFGPGVKLKRITVEITDDPVTSGIEKRLGWLTESLKGYDFHPEGIPVGNFRGLFTTEVFQ